jgi:hypothetical protein
METEESNEIQYMKRCTHILEIADKIKQFIRDREFDPKEALLAVGFVFEDGANRLGGTIARDTMDIFMISQACVRDIDALLNIKDEENAEMN